MAIFDNVGMKNPYIHALVVIAVATGLYLSFSERLTRPVVNKFKVGTNIWIGYEPLYLARSKGYLDEVPIKLVEHSSATAVMHGLKMGRLDAAGLTMDEAITLLSEGVDIKVLWVMDQSNGGDALVSKKVMAHLSDLKGLRVGYESTALGAYMLGRALDFGNLKPEDVELLEMEVSEHEKAFRSDRVDALITFDPLRGQLLAEGAHSLFDSSDIPGEIVDVFVVRSECLLEREYELQSLWKAWNEALSFIQAKPTSAAELMSKRLKTDAEGVIEMLALVHLPNALENQRTMLSGRLKTTAKRLASFMVDSQIIDELPALEAMFVEDLESRFFDTNSDPMSPFRMDSDHQSP